MFHHSLGFGLPQLALKSVTLKTSLKKKEKTQVYTFNQSSFAQLQSFKTVDMTNNN